MDSASPDVHATPGHRVLVSNHHLQVRAGSELVTLEIAETLRDRGHEVRVFTFHPGPAAVEFSDRTGIAVLGPSQRDEILAFGPEVIHAHHWPTLAFLRRIGVDAPVVLGFLGVLPDLENPPPLSRETTIPWWAVSEEVHANVDAVPGWRESPSKLIRNWFDDLAGTPDVRTSSVEMRRILVVSNHFPDELLAVLSNAAAVSGSSVTHVGLPENPRIVDVGLLKSFDAVVSLGRTAITCLAHGIPVLVLDQNGGDGWVTPENCSTLASRNFSGRAMQLDPTPERVAAWLSSVPDLAALQSLQQWAWAEASLRTAVDQLELLYADALSRPPGVLGRWSTVVADYASDSLILTQEVQRLLAERDSIASSLQAAEQALEEAQRRMTDVTGLLQQTRGEVSVLAAERDDLLRSGSWRITKPLRAAKRAVAGVLRRQDLKGTLDVGPPES